jgi:predicted phosphodiesterase
VKYAVIADVHANVPALAAVLASIAREGVDHVVCLGDIVGYGASPNECVALLRDRGIRSISGNHDRAAVGTKDTARFGAAARRAIEWTRSVIRDENREYLAHLPPHLLVDDRFFTVHGALHPEPNDDLHLSNDARVGRSLEELVTGRFGSNLCFFGHSHRAAIHECRAGTVRRIEAAETIVRPDAYYLINPGSVGQSRDRDWRAAYAVFDTDRASVALRRVLYDRMRTETGVRAFGLGTADGWFDRSADWIRSRVDRTRDLVVDRVRRHRRIMPRLLASSPREDER